MDMLEFCGSKQLVFRPNVWQKLDQVQAAWFLTFQSTLPQNNIQGTNVDEILQMNTNMIVVVCISSWK